ncbi:hypothetical protein BFS86_09185 [Shewanella algae]|nr:hypothetical protein BFS86_09185 [Shewanella algae]
MPVIITLIVILSGLIALVGGYVSNFLQVIEMFSQPISGEFLLRAVGIVLFPLGAVLGWL